MEWTVVTVLIALAGFGAAVVKPITNLTRSITTLTVVVQRMQSDLAAEAEHRKESHRRIWAHSGEQDERLNDHERRIGHLEGGCA